MLQVRTASPLFIVFFLAACSAAPKWQHSGYSDPDAAKKQLVVDEGECLMVASGMRSGTVISSPLHGSSNTRSYNFTGSSLNITTGQRFNYTGTVGPASGGFAAGLAEGLGSGAALGAAIAARRAQDKIFQGCMVSRGWLGNTR